MNHKPSKERKKERFQSRKCFVIIFTCTLQKDQYYYYKKENKNPDCISELPKKKKYFEKLRLIFCFTATRELLVEKRKKKHLKSYWDTKRFVLKLLAQSQHHFLHRSHFKKQAEAAEIQNNSLHIWRFVMLQQIIFIKRISIFY